MVRAGDNMKRLLALATLLWGCLAATPAMAALQASVDRNPVAAGESFTLTLQSGDDLDGSPDLSPLQQDFDVLGQSQSTNYQIINGNSSRTTQWQISLMPKHSGQLQIPSLSVDGEQSQPLTITVAAAGQAQAAPQSGDLFLEVSATPRSVYVQQQVVYTVRLFRDVDLGNDASLTEPKVPGGDAIIEKLGKARHYQTLRNGIRYRVIERDYAIYPQKSGSITIPPLVFDGDVVQAGGGGFFSLDPFGQTTQHHRILSEAVTLTVKPTPAAFHGNQWLPARNLQLVEQWSQTPPTFTVGQPITRTVAVMADGLTAAQLPPLTGGTIDGLKQYPDQPLLKDTKDSSGITGMRTEKVAIIPTRPGTVTLPAITVPWWNTATDTLETARLPARTVTVAPAPAGSAPPPAPVANPATAAPAPVAPITATPLSTRAAGAGLWPWLALLLGLGWLATALAWWRQARRRPRPAAPAKDGDVTQRRLEKRLKASCFTNDAAGCKDHLLAWARQRWPEHPPVSLTALAQRCAPPLAAALTALDRALYAPGDTPWQGQELWQQFCRQPPAEGTPTAAKPDDLRPLYRD